MDNNRIDYLIIGGGLAGHSAAKQLINAGSVVMVTEEGFTPYDRPPLSKTYLRGEVDESSIFFEPEIYKHGVKVILRKKVESLDSREGIAILSDGTTIEFSKALIATGGRPRKLGVPGEAEVGVTYFRTLDDARSIRERARGSKAPLVVGAGFLGMELAASLAMMGLRPTVVEAKPQIWSGFMDEKTAMVMQQYFEARGVSFILGETIREFQRNLAVVGDGREIETDLVVASIGIIPNSEVAQRSGISTGNGIIVNEYLETNSPGVYAAGDVANILDPVTGDRRRIEHWNNAEYTGKLAAANMRGSRSRYDFLSTIWSDVFDLHLESAGDAVNRDEELVRGNVNKPSFVTIYLRRGIIIGYLAVNRDYGELEVLNKLIINKFDASSHRKQLVSEEFDLRSLVASN
ncbi:hypothetical protein GCM10007981_09200 [Thermocladium modestius]|uniref:Uncharacterized protein n=1 Tax=Thermocladium modestius TaxID=62609 RepID=A0A830GU07_9CREN|nr:FAD-dependent oxidoreductase [Thermocladium modestius]GGP20573.1 hypothetical protein GCM10007981_09200 [Thermocladium modestius]